MSSFRPVLAGMLLMAMPLSQSIHAAEVQSLEAAARTLAKKLPQGGVVTGEQAGGTATFSLAGNIDLPGVAPERVIFEIGSISKVFTGLLLAQAVVEGRVTLDTPLKEVMGPDPKFSDPRVGEITLRQLATHTSGLPRIPEDLDLGASPGDPYAHYDRSRLCQYLSQFTLPAPAPSAKSYSNLGMGLLGDILARIYDRPWETLVAEKITGPLGMKDTVVTLNAEQQKRFAPPFDGERAVQPWTFQSLAGAGALRSTAADLLILGEAVLHPEKTPLKDAFTLALTPQSRDGSIGLGMGISRIFGERDYEHSGGTGGYRSGLYVLPDSDTVKVILTNNGALDDGTVLGATHAEKPRTTAAEKSLTLQELEDYVGIYPIDSKMRFTILIRDGQLWAQLTGQAFLQLYPHENADRFFYKDVAAEIQFKREEKAITALTLFQNGRELPATKSKEALPPLQFLSTQELATYAGTYEFGPNLVFTLKAKDGTLFAQLTGQPSAPVFPKRKDWFEYDVVPAALEFERDGKDSIIALRLYQNGLIQRAVKK